MGPPVDPHDPLPQPGSGPIASNDRRAAGRASTVLLIGKIHDGRTTTACLVLNLSEFGLMARIGFVAPVGLRVAVEMRGMPLASATVRRVDGTRVALEFDYRQTLDPVFCLMSDDGKVARTPRFAVSLKAVLRIGGHDAPVRIGNISPGGVRLAAKVAVEAGQAGQIVVPGRNLCLFGAVRWVEQEEFGFHFSTPLALGVLSECLSI